MIRWLKDVVRPRTVGETVPELDDRLFKFFGHEDFVRECGEGEVKVLVKRGGGKVFGLPSALIPTGADLGQASPDFVHVRFQRPGQIGHWRRANVIPYDE